LVFDVDLAKSQTEENPVFYVEMAHARLSGIFRVAGRAPETASPDGVNLAALDQPEELLLLKQLADFPSLVAGAAAAPQPPLHPVQVVGVVGSDFPLAALYALEQRGIDLSGVEQAKGESFRWKARYSYDLASRETLETRLGVFADFRPKLPATFRDAEYVFLG